MNTQLQIMLQQGIQAFQSGNFEGANSILKRIIQVDSKNLPALHILGLINASQSNYHEAAVYLARAARIHPNDASIQYNLAKALADSGNNIDAIPHHRKAVALAPNNLEAWQNYGKSFSNLGRYEDALVCYGEALSLKPDYAEALLNKGATLKELKRYTEAIALAEQALSINPNLVEAWSNKGVALKELKRFDEAIAHYDKALSLKPDYAEAWSNKGNALNALKRFDEAIAHYDKALSLKPDYAEAWFNKGLTLNQMKRDIEALAHYDKALGFKPNYPEAWSNKGVSLYALKRYEEAIVHYNQALSLNPDIDWVRGDLVHTKMKICSWSGLVDALDIISKKVGANEKVSQPFILLSLSDDLLAHKKSSELYVQFNYPQNHDLGPILKSARNEKIRIGYFSGDFRNHPVSTLTAELFELHDKDKFEIIAFSFGADDESPMRLRLSQAFNQFIDVSGLPDVDIVKLARDLRIDIAIDLGGHTADSRTGLFAYQVAPIQVSYIGYLGTMGAKYYDYLLADKTIVPDNLQKFYTEKIAYLPSYQVNDRKRSISERKFTRTELGLPESAFVFCCFNNNYKILPATFDCWMRILNSVEGSALFLYADNEHAKSNLIIEAKKRGIDSSRLVFGAYISQKENLARYQACNLFLDTFPYNAGTTASDALWTGLPVLTMTGQSFASRVAASLLNAIGLPELVTNSLEEYEALAIALARNPQKLADIKLKLANNRLTTPLFDTPLFAKNIEAAYIQMYERYQADLHPEHISIS